MTIKLLIRNKKVLDVAIVIHSFSLSPARTSNDFDSDDEAKGTGMNRRRCDCK
jgi:hypothetical protein